MLGFLFLAWDAFSPMSAALGLAGLALLALAVFGLTLLPPFLVRPILALGVVLVVGAGLYQAGQAAGAHKAAERASRAALAAEVARTHEAEAIAAQIGAQAVQDVADEQATNLKLKALNDALARDPNRDRPCGSRDDARRLRAL